MKTALLALVLFTPVTLFQSPTGTVTGHLRSTDGTVAAPGVRVVAVLVPDSSRAEGTDTIVAFSETDASGAYRLENLSPGRYYIRAGLLDLPTYYVGTTIPSEARVVTVAPGSTQSGIDFQLMRAAGVKLSGRVILDPKQKPSAALRRVSLARGAPFVDEVPVNDDGTFEFVRVAPGSYSVVIRGAAAVTRIQVGQKDVIGIELKVPLRYEVTARMVVEPNSPLPVRPVGVFFERSDRQGTQAQFLNDLPITLLFLEGTFQSLPNDVPPGYAVTSVMRGSFDLMKDRLKIPSDETSEIVVTVRAER